MSDLNETWYNYGSPSLRMRTGVAVTPGHVTVITRESAHHCSTHFGSCLQADNLVSVLAGGNIHTQNVS